MKIIFLDHDGVICLHSEFGGRFKKQAAAGRKLSQSITSLPVSARFDNFNKKAVKTLNEILTETGAEIVVSSDWKRYATVEELGDYYTEQGIIKRPIDATDYCRNLQMEGKLPSYNEFKWERHRDLEQERHFEILQWLKEHPEVTHWCAIDDLHMGISIDFGDGLHDREWGLRNFVWTNTSEGIKRSGVKEKILKFFENNQPEIF